METIIIILVIKLWVELIDIKVDYDIQLPRPNTTQIWLTEIELWTYNFSAHLINKLHRNHVIYSFFFMNYNIIYLLQVKRNKYKVQLLK